MADINLLQNNHPQHVPEGGSLPESLNYFGAAILIIAVLASVGCWYLAQQTAAQSTQIAAQISQTEKSVTTLPNYQTFITEQASLSGLSSLVANHLDWSKPVVSIAGFTLKSASYSSITINQNGSATLQGTVPSYADLDRYMQALNSKSISPSVLSATLQTVSAGSGGNGGNSSGTGNAVSGSASSISFTVNITFDKTLWGVPKI